MVNAICPHIQPSYAEYLERPITAEELYTALKSGGPQQIARVGWYWSRILYKAMGYHT